MWISVYSLACFALVPQLAYASGKRIELAARPPHLVQRIDYAAKDRWWNNPIPARLSAALVGLVLPENENADYKVAKISLSESTKTLLISYERSPLLRAAPNSLRPPGLFYTLTGSRIEPQPRHFEQYGYVALDSSGQKATVLHTVFGQSDFASSFAKLPVLDNFGHPPAKLSTFEGMPVGLEFSRSGRKAVAMMREGKIHLFDSARPTQLETLELGANTAALHARYSANERFLAVCVFDISQGELDEHEIQVIDTAKPVKVSSVPFPKGDCRSFDFSPDGQKVFYVKSGSLYAWEVPTEQETLITKLAEPSYRLAHSPRDPFLLIGRWGERVSLVNTLSGETVAEIQVGEDRVATRLVGFGDNGADFFASTDSTDLAWGDLNRLGGPPQNVKEALHHLASPSFRNFQATRWLTSHPSELVEYLDTNTQQGPLPEELPALLESMVRDWDSDKYQIRQSASVRGMRALEKLSWGQQRAAQALVENLTQAARARSTAPLEIEHRYKEWLQFGDLPILQKLQTSEPYRRQIDSALGKPYGWGN